jgi:hypothetical protein
MGSLIAAKDLEPLFLAYVFASLEKFAEGGQCCPCDCKREQRSRNNRQNNYKYLYDHVCTYWGTTECTKGFAASI